MGGASIKGCPYVGYLYTWIPLYRGTSIRGMPMEGGPYIWILLYREIRI